MKFYDPQVLMFAMNGLRNAQSARAQGAVGTSATKLPLAVSGAVRRPTEIVPDMYLNPNTHQWTPTTRKQ
jgi:hypothetical protein